MLQSKRAKNVHVREDRTLREVCFVDDLPHRLAQINYTSVDHGEQVCDLHRHGGVWETFVCCEGTLFMQVDSYFHVLEAGEQISVAPNTLHSLRAKEGTRYLELRSKVYEMDDPDKEFM